MAIDNRQITKAITALYRCTSNGVEWSDTDEMIQQAAFALWNACEISSDAMAELLLQESDLTPEVIADFCDIPLTHVYDALRQGVR